MKRIKNHTNEIYGRLRVLQFIERKNNKSYWKCKCQCGNEIILPITYLTSGDTKSCGCLRKETTKKLSKSNSFVKNHRLYTIWIDMRRRCYNKNRNNYIFYGAKGIKVCKEWNKDFKNFQDWAINNGYQDNLTIDRINVDGNYEPDNCRWVTTFEQNNNMRSNHKIEYENKIYNSMSSFCREKDLNYSKFKQRIKRGYSIQEAMYEGGVQ